MEEAGAVPFGRYVLRSMLARGGMGEVFRAVAVGADGFEKPVVVKRILPTHAQSPRVAELFVAEAKLGSRLVHPNIVQVIDFGRGPDGAYFLVLEHVEGCDLRRLAEAFAARSQPIPIAVVLQVGIQVLRGLHHAHTRAGGAGGVVALVHRDVSPGNVLLSIVGEVKVADFGVALVASEGAAGGSSDVVAGKLAYMAPEQFAGADVDPRADLFATSAMLFELLTGQLPFAGEALEYRMAAHAGAVRDVTALRSDVSPALARVLARGLSPQREARFPDARSMAQALEGLGERVASSDELAELVASVVDGTGPAARPVVRLGLGLAAAPEPASGEEPLREATEIVRYGDGTFMMRATPTTAAPVPEGLGGGARSPSYPDAARSTVRLDAPGPHAIDDEPIPPPPRRPLWPWAVGGLLLLTAVALVAVRALAPAEGGASDGLASAATGSVSPPPSAPSADSTAFPAASADAGTPKDPTARLPPASRAPTSAGASASAPPPLAPQASAAPDAVCRGSVHLYADHGWVVSGGPATVQAPGRYDWPCGTYALTAVSRTDPADTRKKSVAVGVGAPAVVDLR